MSAPSLDPVLEKLRDAERLVLDRICDQDFRRAWDELEACKLAIWKAIEKVESANV